MARLLSVNVGLLRDIAWQGRTVHTAVWKAPVQGRRIVRRLNIDGDGQGDLAGMAASTGPSSSIRWPRIAIGRTGSAAATSPMASSGRTSPSTGFPTTRGTGNGRGDLLQGTTFKKVMEKLD